MREEKKGIPQILENKLTHAHYHHAIGTRPYFNRPGIEARATVAWPPCLNFTLGWGKHCNDYTGGGQLSGC